MSGYVQSNQIVILANANDNINTSDTGKILITPQTAGAVTPIYTLPLPAAGLHYRFINGSAGALNGSVQINTNGAAGILYGNVIGGPVNGIALLAVSANTQTRFLTAASLVGDFIDLISDGTNWYVNAVTRVGGAITVT